MPPLRLLHITNWYPEPSQPCRVPFIAEHVDALAPHARQQLWHLEVQEVPRRWRWEMVRRSADRHALILSAPVASWQLRELLTLLLLVALRLRLWRGRWDLVVVHIAYPLLRFPRLVRLLFGRRLLLIEHWSAYHHHFHLPPHSPARRRLQRMFSQDIPVVAVSQALAADLRQFAARPDLQVFVVPNVVDTALFHPDPLARGDVGSTVLMVASWAPIKRPFLVLAAIRALVPLWPALRLRVIGGGEQLDAMRSYITEHGLADHVRLLGPQPKSRIAAELRQTAAFLHPSAYETFSVVCAEALCCGVPVLASAVGALPELINASNGQLVANTPEAWSEALQRELMSPPARDRAAIARQAAQRFSRQAVGTRLHRVVEAAAAGHDP
jgi:glycosyltransferase involved in cell wall biosynthesis